MKPLIYYRLIPFIVAISQTDGAVNVEQIGTKAGDASCQCGTELLLSCHIDQYSLSMTWQNDSSVLPFAQCVLNDCKLDEKVNGLFEFSSNTSTGIFNLTIIQVSLDNDNVIYTCSDGTNNDGALVRVKDYEPTVDESTPGKIKMFSGCIDPSTNVTLEWWKVKNGTEEETEYEPKSSSSNISNCMGDANCARSTFVQKLVSISEQSDGDYRLKAVFFYDGVRVESRLTDLTYKLEGNATIPTTKSSTNTTTESGNTVRLVDHTDTQTNSYLGITGKQSNRNQLLPLLIGAGVVVLVSLVTLTGNICCLGRNSEGE